MRLSIITVSLLLAACGGGSSDGDTPAAPADGPQVETPGTPGGVPVPNPGTPGAPDDPFTVSDDPVGDGTPGDGEGSDTGGTPIVDSTTDADSTSDDVETPDAGSPPDDGEAPDNLTPDGDSTTDADGVPEDATPGDDGATDTEGATDDASESGGDATTDTDDADDADATTDTDDADDADDASGNDGSPPDDTGTTDEGTSDGSGTPNDDGTPDDDDTSDGDATPDDTGTSDDVASAPSVIDASNYVSLTEFAIQMNVIILTDRGSSPVSFVDRFPPDIAALREEGRAGGPDAPATTSGSCPSGGSYSGTASTGGPFSSYRVDYESCRTETGTLRGFSQGGFASRETDVTHELEYSYPDSDNGPGTTVFEGVLSTGDVGSRSFEVEDYSRNTPRDGFAVRNGSGSGGPVQDLPDDAYSYTSRTEIRIQGDDGPINLDVAVDGFVIANGGPLEGTVTLTAQDDSRVDVAPGDSPDTVRLTRTDSAGDAFTDTVAWSDVYKP